MVFKSSAIVSSAVKEGTRFRLCVLFLLVWCVFVFVPVELFWIREPKSWPPRGPCLNGTEPPLLARSLGGEAVCRRKIPIRAADPPGVLQAQPGSGDRCQEPWLRLAARFLPSLSSKDTRSATVANAERASAETLAKHRDSAGTLLVSSPRRRGVLSRFTRGRWRALAWL